MTERSLEQDWKLKRRNHKISLESDFATSENWLPSTAPSTVYQTLLDAGVIPDPYFNTNELDVQWVGEADWLYKLEFDASKTEKNACLCFDGLDTFATVWLNGLQILKSENMFVPSRIEVVLQEKNALHILFESAWFKGLELQAANGGKRPLWNGDSSRLYVRKAQYHYSWDWGPKLVDLGLWRSVRLETFSARIAEWHVQPELNAGLDSARLPVSVKLEGALKGAKLVMSLLDPNGSELSKSVLDVSNQIEFEFRVDEPKLWYPHLHGDQPLYTVILELVRGGQHLDFKTQKIGLRQIRVVQEAVANEAGSSFYFEVNGIPMLMGGANWIPDDLMLTRVTRKRYAQRIAQVKAANMQMLRVWGGGIYEDDAFYELCDEAGILVWQDFMFGCGIYPAHAEFIKSVRLEAIANIKRLRHHPCLAIWTGNNEDYPLAFGQGLYKTDLSPEENPEMPARVIYERLLPELLQELDPGRYYQPGSPFYGKFPDDPTIADRHTWDVWGGMARPYRDYIKLEGRFVSEFGMASAAHLSTLEAVLPPEERHPQSRGFEHHMKAGEGIRRLNAYITDTQKLPTNLSEFVYATQLVQSEAMDCAYRIWRRRWGVAGKRAVGGALVWQINDCWAVSSWAIIDSSATPKPAYYTIKRALAPLSINLWNDGSVWALNTSLEPVHCKLELQALNLSGVELNFETREVIIPANGVLELGVFAPKHEGAVVIAARLLTGNTVIARHSLFPEPFKYFDFQAPEIELEWQGKTLRISSRKPVKGVFIHGLNLTDNMFDLIPGDVQTISLSSIPKSLPKSLKAQWLGGSGVLPVKRDELVTHD
jgi:beta-mannosidase